MRWFIAHLLAHLPRLWDIYNSALLEYRHEHKVRSSAHPVPELAAVDNWLEAPLWIWSIDDPRRRRLFVQSAKRRIDFFRPRHFTSRLTITADGSADTAIGQLAELSKQGVRIRTRALITTLAARLLLGDLFIHGIGGTKYDRLTDRILERFFGIEPPGYLMASGTLRLPVAHRSSAGELRDLRHRLRELDFQPERFLADGANASIESSPALAQLIAEKRRWIATSATLANSRERCRTIRKINQELQPAVSSLRNSWTAELCSNGRARAMGSDFCFARLRFFLVSPIDLDKFFVAHPGKSRRERVSYRKRMDRFSLQKGFEMSRAAASPVVSRGKRLSAKKAERSKSPARSKSKSLPAGVISKLRSTTTSLGRSSKAKPKSVARRARAKPIIKRGVTGNGRPHSRAVSQSTGQRLGNPAFRSTGGDQTAPPAPRLSDQLRVNVDRDVFSESAVPGEIRLVQGRSGDHASVYHMLLAVFQGPSRDEFHLQAEDPFYEPSDRLLVKRGFRVISHLHVTHRSMLFGRLTLPIAGIHWLGTLPEFRNQGLATSLLRRAHRRMAAEGALLGLLRTRAPDFFIAPAGPFAAGIRFRRPKGAKCWATCTPSTRRNWHGR